MAASPLKPVDVYIYCTSEKSAVWPPFVYLKGGEHELVFHALNTDASIQIHKPARLEDKVSAGAFPDPKNVAFTLAKTKQKEFKIRSDTDVKSKVDDTTFNAHYKGPRAYEYSVFCHERGEQVVVGSSPVLFIDPP
jgi:hypothetical protein